MLEDADVKKLPVVRGERRSSQYDHRSGNLYGYTTSARMYLKQMNFAAEKWLQNYAEPLNGLAALAGMDTGDQYLALAWNYLLGLGVHLHAPPGAARIAQGHRRVQPRCDP